MKNIGTVTEGNGNMTSYFDNGGELWIANYHRAAQPASEYAFGPKTISEAIERINFYETYRNMGTHFNRP